MHRQKKIVTYMRERAPQKHIFSGLKIHLHTYNQCSSLLLFMAWRYIRQYNDKTLLIEKNLQRADKRKWCKYTVRIMGKIKLVSTKQTYTHYHIHSTVMKSSACLLINQFIYLFIKIYFSLGLSFPSSLFLSLFLSPWHDLSFPSIALS